LWQIPHFLNMTAPFSTSCADATPAEAVIMTTAVINILTITVPLGMSWSRRVAARGRFA